MLYLYLNCFKIRAETITQWVS